MLNGTRELIGKHYIWKICLFHKKLSCVLAPQYSFYILQFNEFLISKASFPEDENVINIGEKKVNLRHSVRLVSED